MRWLCWFVIINLQRYGNTWRVAAADAKPCVLIIMFGCTSITALCVQLYSVNKCKKTAVYTNINGDM